MKKYIISPEKDYKALEINKELNKLGVRLITLNSSIKMPIYLILYVLKYGRPEAIIYRYLNDYPSFFKTIIRTLFELLGILVATCLNLKVIWICHNVDRETIEHYPLFTKIRRKALETATNKIMVTDPLLVPHAKKQFPKSKEKIDYITFGQSQSLKNTDTEKVVLRIQRFIDFHLKRNSNTQFGFVAGHISWKTSQYEKIPELIQAAESQNKTIVFIVIGPIGNYLRKHNKILYNEFKINEKVLFLDGYYPLDMDEISKLIDFYWRVYLDLSIPGTVYEATQYEKPIITQKHGFLAQAVREYSIGYILNEDYSNLSSILNKITNWDHSKSRNFLETHTWKKAAEKIMNSIK